MAALPQVNKTSENRDCSQPLVQATANNKKILFRAIDQLEDGGMASYSNALTFAYEAFIQVSHSVSPSWGSTSPSYQIWLGHKTQMICH